MSILCTKITNSLFCFWKCFKFDAYIQLNRHVYNEYWLFQNYGSFVHTYFRSRTFAPKSESTIGGTFAPWNFCSLELPVTICIGPLNFRPVPMQLKKRITVAASAKECSSLPTNVALQSVLASRHVRLTHDVVWHGISKDYEVVTERIDKLRLQLTRTSDRLYYVLIYL